MPVVLTCCGASCLHVRFVRGAIMPGEAASTAGSDPVAASVFSDLVAAVSVLSHELRTVRHEGSEELSARLAAADDELAAVHEEIRRQQQIIEDLLSDAPGGQAATTRRFLRDLPLATILTDAHGVILEANTAARTVLGVSSAPVPGTPIFAYVAQPDGRRLRTALSQAGTRDELIQASTVLPAGPGGRAAIPLHLALIRESVRRPADGGPGIVGPDGAGRPDERTAVRWIVMPDYTSLERPPSHGQLEALTQLCRLRSDAGSDLRSLLASVVQLCLQAVPEADHASLVIGDPMEPTLTLASSAMAQHLDGVQHQRSDGPVLDAYRSRRPMALGAAAVTEHPGLRGDPEAAKVTSLLAVPLIAHSQSTGVFTLYAHRSPELATTTALREALPFVEASQTLVQDAQWHEEMRRTHEQLQTALISRAVIDQAKGIVMGALKCDAEQAFQFLSRISGTRHEKLRDVAQQIVDSAALGQGPSLAHE
jgi:PAS domain S-box-containing protein